MGEMGSRDKGSKEGGPCLARHLRHSGGRCPSVRQGCSKVQGHQGQAQLP